MLLLWNPLSNHEELFQFRETINHNGAPYRVAFTFGNDTLYEEYVLYDHIPHNDQGTGTLLPSRAMFSISSCEGLASLSTSPLLPKITIFSI